MSYALSMDWHTLIYGMANLLYFIYGLAYFNLSIYLSTLIIV